MSTINKISVCWSRSSTPGVWRAPTGLVLHVESLFEVEDAQLLHLEVKMKKNINCVFSLLIMIFFLFRIFPAA